MTQIQLDYQKLQETKRHNEEMEAQGRVANVIANEQAAANWKRVNQDAWTNAFGAAFKGVESAAKVAALFIWRLLKMDERKKVPGSSKPEESPKGDKPFRKGKRRHFSKDAKDNRSEEPKPFIPGNDFAWWNKVPELMKDAVNLKVNSIAGSPVFGNASQNTAVIPGVMRLITQNTYGADYANTDPVNLQFRDLFLRMFQKYRGITSYQYADLAAVEIAAMEVFSVVAKLERIYGVINYYDKLNLNVPTTLLAALGINSTVANIIRTRLSDYRYDLNYLIRKASRICMPKDLSIMADRISLYGYLYKDHDAKRSQIYVFDFDSVGIFDETSLTTGSAIRFENLTGNITSGSITGNPLLQFVDNNVNMFYALDRMISALVGSDSVNKIFADLVVWFGEESMLTMVALPEDYIVVPVYSESILHKIHNADILATDDQVGTADEATPLMRPIIDGSLVAADIAALGSATNRWIYQTPNGTLVTGFMLCDDATITNDQFTFRGNAYQGKMIGADGNFSLCGLFEYGRVLDSYHEEFTDELVCEGSIWKTVPVNIESDQGYHCIVMASCTFEIIVQAVTYTLHSNGTVGNTSLIPASIHLSASRFATFDWSPLLYQEWLNGAYGAVIYEVLGDIDTYRAISANEVSKIHAATVLSGVTTGVTVVSK